MLRTLVVLLAVALATSGFAHRIATPSETALAAYVQSFGLDASDICGDAEGKTSGQGCVACRLQAAMALPEPAVATVLAELALDPADWTPAPAVLHALTSVSTHPARAPPAA